jgi:hypothetical protein
MNSLLDLLSKHMHLVILAIYGYVLIYQVKDNDYLSMVLLTIATCMTICYLKKNTYEGQANQATTGATPPVVAKKDDKPKVNPEAMLLRQLPSSMGPYDGLCLQTGNKEHWMKTPDETKLIPNDALFAFLGSQGPEKPVFSDNSALMGPPIDGKDGSPKKMFMFANNRSSPNCCPSTYSTSTGCVCTTKGQRDFVASRGGAIDLQEI